MNVDFTSKTREALQKPLHQRCEEIKKLIEGSSTQNLHGFFPQLLSSIFGYSGSSDWGLKTFSRDSREFCAVRKFLSPDGAVFKLIDLLQADDQHKYEFFISCLPFPTQNSLSEGIIPVLYQNKVPIRGPGETVHAVLLNTFEYYMFHFAYYIVHHQTNWESSINSNQDYLYLIVLDDYLNFLLPSDGSGGIVSSSSKSKASLGSVRKGLSSWHDPSHYARLQYFQNQFKGLIKPSSGRVSPPTVHHGMFDRGSQEMWRSETFLQILIEFWLNQNTVHSVSSNVLSHGKEYFMPSVDHVRVVRILVKHVHSFVFAKGPDMTQYSNLHPSDELRRVIIPQFLQKKLYHFLHHCFSHWPLDPSFRIVLETWLSYVQPWRYLKVRGSMASIADDSRETATPEWKLFIFENLLFYSALLYEFISRACRFNLYSAKDAYLLFRVIKVFAQPHLVDMIEEGENTYLTPSRSGYNTPQTSLSTPCSVIKAHVVEMEGPFYLLKSLFHFPGTTKISELHFRVSSALDESTNKSQSTHQSLEDNEGFFTVFMKALNSDTSQGTGLGRNAEEDKLVSYLEQTNKFLSNIVKAPDLPDGTTLNKTIQWESSSPVHANRHLSLTGTQASPPDHVEADGGVVPTPLGRYQMMNGLRKFEVKYSGDPELQPIRSFENPTLVRLLYKLSTQANQMFGKTLEDTYATSRLFRRITGLLSPAVRSASIPTPSRQPSTSSLYSPQKKVQPQISLRFLASYRTLFYLFVLLLFCKVTSLNSVLVFLLWILVLVVILVYHLKLPYQKTIKLQ